MKDLYVGQIVFKKVFVTRILTNKWNYDYVKILQYRDLNLLDKWGDDIRYITAILKMEVIEPGFIADWEERVPDDGSRSGFCVSNIHQKGRVRAAKVLEVLDENGNPFVLPDDVNLSSSYDIEFNYKVGETYRPDAPFDDVNVTCAPGIHCFETFEQAVNYHL